MRRLCHKLTTSLLLGGYLLAVTVGGAFHTHMGNSGCTGQDDSAAPCDGPVCHAGHAHETGHTHGIRASSSKTPESPALEAVVVLYDPHCPICTFLSQKPIPVAIYASEDSTELNQPLVRVRAIPPSDDIPTTVFGRGPPSIA